MPVVNGTTYNDATPMQLIEILEEHRINQWPARFVYGDRETGIAWGGPHPKGRVGRSTGSIQIPLVIATTRSLGGGGLLDDSIILLEESRVTGNARDRDFSWVNPRTQVVYTDPWVAEIERLVRQAVEHGLDPRTMRGGARQPISAPAYFPYRMMRSAWRHGLHNDDFARAEQHPDPMFQALQRKIWEVGRSAREVIDDKDGLDTNGRGMVRYTVEQRLRW